MMRNRSRYALAVRKRDGEIAVQVHEIHSIMDRHPWMRWPFIRGVFSFVSSLRIGMSTLMESSKYYEESSLDEEEARERAAEDDAARSKREKTENGMLIGTLILSLALAIGLFSFLPVLIASPIKNLTDSHFVLALVEGVVRVLIFVGYVWLISFMKDIRRTYMYHGAEHKCINCIETGLPLNVENVRMSSREHRRCGTSFLLIVMLISIFIFMFIRVDNIFLRLLSRLLMIPVIASVSFEFLQLAGRSNTRIMYILSRPGMWLQHLTTREPDDDQIEVAIAAVEAVFDWRAFLGMEPEEPGESGQELGKSKPEAGKSGQEAEVPAADAGTDDDSILEL